MTTQQVLDRISYQMAGINLQTALIDKTNMDKDDDVIFDFSTVGKVQFGTGKDTSAFVTFEEEEDYRQFVKALLQMEKLDASEDLIKTNIVTFRPFNEGDGDDKVVYAAGYIGMYAYSDEQKAVRFVFQDGDFEAFSMDLSKVLG